MKNKTKINILDCTIRDGGYLNDWQFDMHVVRDVYRAVSKAGVDVMEIGFRSSKNAGDFHKYGKWRFSNEELLREAIKDIHGTKLAVMSDFGQVAIEDFPDAKESIVDIVRLATNKENLFLSLDLLEKIKIKDYVVSLNVMGYANYSQNDKKELLSLLNKTDIDIVYIADSYGSMFPSQIKPFLEPFLELDKMKVGFHAHNNLQMAFANTLEAIRCGIQFVDCTLYGMGRGAGNLPTEILILYMQLLDRQRYNVIPVLNCIDAHFLSFKREIEWGYQLHYMLSGMYKCHPNYARELVEMREFTVEDICKAMDIIQQNKPSSFSKKTLNHLIENGLIPRSSPKIALHQMSSQVPLPAYVNRHPNKDFLILANGSSLKQFKLQIQQFIQKNGPIVMGANNLSDLFFPNYQAFNNKKRFIQYVDSVSDQSNLLLSQYFSEEFIRDYTKREFEFMCYQDTLNNVFDIQNDVIQANCRTVSILLIGIAIVMGAKKIFVAGMDGYLPKNGKKSSLYYEEKNEKTDIDFILAQHQWCQRFLDQINHFLEKRGNDPVCILTPTSYDLHYVKIEEYLKKI